MIDPIAALILAIALVALVLVVIRPGRIPVMIDSDEDQEPEKPGPTD